MTTLYPAFAPPLPLEAQLIRDHGCASSPRGLQERIVRISNRSARSGLASGDDPAPRLHHRGRIHPIGHFQIGASGRLDADQRVFYCLVFRGRPKKTRLLP